MEKTQDTESTKDEATCVLRIQAEIRRLNRVIAKATEDKKALNRTLAIAFASKPETSSEFPKKKPPQVPYSLDLELPKILKARNRGYTRGELIDIMREKFGMVNGHSLSSTLSNLKDPDKHNPPKVEHVLGIGMYRRGIWYSTEVPRID